MNLIDSCYNHQFHVTCLFYVIITNTMAYWYDGAALAATRSPVIALFWCLIKFITTTTITTTTPDNKVNYKMTPDNPTM